MVRVGLSGSRSWERPLGGLEGVAMTDQERACLPEAMRSCPTVGGGCDLTSLGTSVVTPPSGGDDDSSCHSSREAPCQLSTVWGQEGGLQGDLWKSSSPFVFSLPSHLSLPPLSWGGGVLLATWVPISVPHWLWYEPWSHLCPIYVVLTACVTVSPSPAPRPLHASISA